MVAVRNSYLRFVEAKSEIMKLKCYLGFITFIVLSYWFVQVCRAQDGKLQIVYVNQTYINSSVKQQNNYGVGSGNHGAELSESGANGGESSTERISKPDNSEFSPYFGVVFDPFVKSASTPLSDYTTDDLVKMLKLILTKSHSLLTLEMGYQDSKATNGPWDITTTSQISKIVAKLNNEHNKLLLTVSQGAGVLSKPGFQPDIEAAFYSAKHANSIFPGSVWSITLMPNYKDANTDGFLQISTSGEYVLGQVASNLNRAHELNLKLGVMVNDCENILGGSLKPLLVNLAKSSDYLVCSVFPDNAINEPQDYFNWVISKWQTLQEGFQRFVPGFQVILHTGWATDGKSRNNPEYMNSPKKSKAFWNAMQRWSDASNVKVFMQEAFDVPKNVGNESWGYWSKTEDGGNFVEKFSGRIVSL